MLELNIFVIGGCYLSLLDNCGTASRLHKLFALVTLIDDTKNVKSVRDVAEKYKLLPNDALIAATCKHYDIKNIATFDSDFDSVDFLDVVTV